MSVKYVKEANIEIRVATSSRRSALAKELIYRATVRDGVLYHIDEIALYEEDHLAVPIDITVLKCYQQLLQEVEEAMISTGTVPASTTGLVK